MAPCEECALRSGDWCSRLSWPRTPVTSFRWGRVVTITVSPGGAASPARRDVPRRSSGIPCARTAAPGFRRGGTPAYDGDIPRGRVRVLPGGGIRRRRGQQSRPPTRRMPPAMRKCPRTRRTSPATAPECGVFMPRPKTPVRRESFDCRYSPPPAGGDPAARSHSDSACHLLHEGRVPLEEGRVYSRWVGPSCSTHNPRAVDPHPRTVDRAGDGPGRNRRRNHYRRTPHRH